MIDWGSFVTGLVGAVIGGGATLGVQVFALKNARRAKQEEAIGRLDSGLRRMVGAAFVYRSGCNGHGVQDLFDSFQECRAATVNFVLVTRRKDSAVSAWLDGRVMRVRDLAFDADGEPVQLMNSVDRTMRELAEWMTGRRKASALTPAPDSQVPTEKK